MDIFAVSLAVVSGICLGTGLIHLFIGLRRPGSDMKYLAFGLFALAYGGAVLTGLLMYRAASLPQFLAADRWSGVFAGLTYIFLIWFVAVYTEVQPLPFLAALTVLFSVLIAAHVSRPTLIHGEIVGISVIFLPWGEEIAFLEAAESVWEFVFILDQLVTIAFVFYACYRQYRRGERPEAMLLGTGMFLFVATIVFDIFVESGLISFVLASDFGFLPLAAVMSLKLAQDVIGTENELARHRNKLEALVEQRTAELNQSHRTARALLDAPPNSAMLIDPEGSILDINETAASRLGTSETKAQGMSAYDLLEPHVAEVRRAKVTEAVESGLPVRWEDVRSGRYIDNTVYPIRDDIGQVTNIAVFGTDITEQRQAEATLQLRVAELAGLNRVAQTLATVTDLPSAMSQVSAMITELFGARYTHVLLPAEGDADLRIMVSFDRESGPEEASPLTTRLDDSPFLSQALHSAESTMIPDFQSLALEDPVREYLAKRGVQSVLLVPLLSHGTAVGLLTLALDEPGRQFTPEEKRLAETFAGDLAAAIENARLAELAQVAAVNEERGRIARDLHDSVTQTLYSASLIAEALPRVWDRSPAEVKPNLTTMLMLIRGALAEMRTLLFELRPVALEEASLSRLLHQQADLLTGRTQVPVEVTIQGKDHVPAEVKIALYRIAQEAFNNIIKHAHATQVTVTLRNLPTKVRLTIRDDGRGFDPGLVPPERMGLRIMHERAEQIEAGLDVASELGEGTQVVVAWPADDRRSTQ